MAESTEQAVVAALEVALRDHGWLAASDPSRLRATLSDLLGAHADDHRGALDAIVVSAEEGVPAELRSAGRSGAAGLRPELVDRLVDWGMSTDRAAWVVDAWTALVPESTLEPLVAPVVVEETALPEPEPEAPAATDLPPPEPVVTPTAVPPVVPVTALPPSEAPPVERAAPPPPPGRRSRLPWYAAAAVVVVLAGAGAAVALGGGDGGDPPEGGPSETPTSTPSSTPTPEALPTGQLVASDDVSPARASARVVMAGRDGRVRVSAFGEVDQVGELVAAEDAKLVAFTLADAWRPLDLQVALDGKKPRALPKGGPTFVVAAPADAEVELVYRDAGFDQRVSLLTGEATGENIEVLVRTGRTDKIRETKQMNVTASGTSAVIPNLDRVVTVRDAFLEFFDASTDKHPTDPSQAYLRFELSYYRPGSAGCPTPGSCGFTEGDVTFEDNEGETYDAIDLIDDPAITRLAFLVPADLTGGTLIIEGPSPSTAEDGITFTANLQRTTFRAKF